MLLRMAFAVIYWAALGTLVAAQERANATRSRDADDPSAARSSDGFPAHELATSEYKVGGRVVAPDGKPAPGVKLYVVGDPLDPKVRAFTDVDGRFEFAMKKSEFGLNDSGVNWQFSMILASGDGYGVDFRPAYCFELSGQLSAELAVSPYPASDQWDRTLRLVEDDVPVVGEIVDRKGQPVAGANIRVTSIWACNDENLTPWLEAVRKGEDYDIVMLKMMDRQIGIGAGSKLLPAAASGRDGTFQLQCGIGRERIANLVIEGPGIVSETVFVRTRPGTLLRVPHVLEAPRAGVFRFHGTRLKHVSHPSLSIVGKVVDVDSGAPIPGVSIQIRAGARDGQSDVEFAGSAVRAITDEYGRYRVSGVPIGEDHTMLAIPVDSPYLPSAKRFDMADVQTSAIVDFQLKRGVRIHGRVIDGETGEPVRAMLTYFVPTDNPRSRSAPGFGEAWIVPWQPPYLSDEEGRYTNVALPGRGFLAVSARDWRRYPRGDAPERTRLQHANWPDVVLQTYPINCLPESYHYVTALDLPEDTESYEYDIVLSPGQQLHGKVNGSNGEPLAGATYGGLTEVDGPYFHLASPNFCVNCYQPDKPRTIYFVHNERKLAGGRVLEGPQKDPLIVRLEPWGTITGRIVDADGKPRGKQLIRGYAPGHGNRPGRGEFPERHYRSDEEGRFRIEGLVPGLKYDLDVIEDGQIIGTSAIDLRLKAGEVRDLRDVALRAARRG